MSIPASLQPLRPTLYRLAADGRSLDFFYARCPDCSRLTFPANAPGCRHCGTPLSEAVRIGMRGGGTLLEFVTLHVPLAPGMAAPAIVGDIRIAGDLVEEGVLGVDAEAGLQPGMTLRAIARPCPDGAHFDCVFVPENQETPQ
ncbi:Zn-ribbon domain-containing OB-fold protein [Cupriavidus sp. AU9028]|uniref:Zn-ribbon domain-containing OB-fold protein n=1 Tax=Cupriavidus sp. AU9028 TaxID=2871157 RepID=UPI001C97E3AF|nr:zinc ribbon domain-containing protein [Cupriavidus sp. AU9028]MBY4898473.1 zinc ribbon domain-containing protein [Cupriavidus sp. AU9028]